MELAGTIDPTDKSKLSCDHQHADGNRDDAEFSGDVQPTCGTAWGDEIRAAKD